MARDDDEDVRPAGKKASFEQRPLEALSIAELEDYIADLQAEITRAEEAIGAKRQVRQGADSLFGKKKQ